MQTIALDNVPSQDFNVMLDGQYCQISVYTTSYGLFLDLSINDIPIATGNLCQDRNPIIIKAYLGLQGKLMFVDMKGINDPTYDELGTRYVLFYFSQN